MNADSARPRYATIVERENDRERGVVGGLVLVVLPLCEVFCGGLVYREDTWHKVVEGVEH
jgi:hypothetical protein